MHKAIAVLLGTAAVALSGCGLKDPYANTTSTSTTTAANNRQPAGESAAAPKPEPLATPSGSGAGTPAQAASLYARAYANWSWRDVARKNGATLAALAAGTLRDDVRANSRALAQDATLTRDRPANRGEQLALDVHGDAPDRRTVWIVMRETASARGVAGDGSTTTTVYRVRVARIGARWYVTAFEPQR